MPKKKSGFENSGINIHFIHRLIMYRLVVFIIKLEKSQFMGSAIKIRMV